MVTRRCSFTVILSPGRASRAAGFAVAAGALAAVLAGTGGACAATPAEACAARAAAGDHRACAAAVSASPGDPVLRRLYAISLSKAGRYDEALAEYRRVAEMEPRRFRAQYELGWMLAFVRRYAEAVQPLRNAAALRPRDIRVYRALTVTLAALRRPTEALRTALAGARLGDPIAMFDVADHYRNGRGVARDTGRAVAWLERAAHAGHVRAMHDLVRIYLHGELGQKPNDAKAEAWAAEARRARNR